MNYRTALRLRFGKKVLLGAATVAAIAVPIAIGIANAPQIRAQSAESRPAFEVASIKPGVRRAAMDFRCSPARGSSPRT